MIKSVWSTDDGGGNKNFTHKSNLGITFSLRGSLTWEIKLIAGYVVRN